MTTYAYDAKSALITRLQAWTAPGEPLEGLQVAYAFPGSNVDLECVYGGGVRFEQRDAVAETPGVLVAEESLVSLYIRVMSRPPCPVEETDARCLAIGTQIATLLRAEPHMAGGNSILGIVRGQGDYSQSDDETTSILSYQIRVTVHLNYGVV